MHSTLVDLKIINIIMQNISYASYFYAYYTCDMYIVYLSRFRLQCFMIIDYYYNNKMFELFVKEKNEWKLSLYYELLWN